MEIHYVTELGTDTNDPVLRKIDEFCKANGIRVLLRSFDAYTYEEDSMYITHLPAIQIYKRSVYEDTIYPDFKPVQFLRMEFEKFQLEELAREAKKQIWEERLRYLKSIFNSSKTDSKASTQNR
jgi:hypothetical protein